ncbi:MAG: MetQ/NlpA family ABC transporter substrate-binding protein [Parachlamydiaceae bacterium]
MIRHFIPLQALRRCFALCGLFAAIFTGCEDSGDRLKVAASSVPHAQLLEFIKPDLKAQGIDLVIIVSDDYNMPNRALASGEIDANFFQHLPFLDEQIKQFHYSIESIGAIELEPMAIYSKKIKSLADLKEKSVLAVPNDPTNEARALLLFQDQGLVELDDSHNLQATVRNIKKNPKHLKFIEVDAAMLPRTLEDVDAAAINTNYALGVNLSPSKDALVIEGADSPYANILVVRIGDEKRPDIAALKKALTSEKMREFILEKYKGAILPVF